MVKIFTTKETELIAKTVAEVEKHTNAEIAAVVLPISDRYISEMMFYGFLLGSAIAFLIWKLTWIKTFPLLFLFQLLGIFSLPFIPGITSVFLKCLPKKLLFHRAAHLGAEELLAINQQVPPDTPVVLLFISLGEHYIHLFANSVVKSKISDGQWDVLVHDFTAKLKTQDLATTCTEAIQTIGKILAPNFPDKDGINYFSDIPFHK